MNGVAGIIKAIEELTPAQRRQLQRRLRASGLLEPELCLTDQNKLQVAIAVSHPRRETAPPAAGTAPAPMRTESRSVYQPPVSGRVVVGAPAPAPLSEPHAMAPLPGQAPEQPIVIVFDGGSKGNPGEGYGSYQLLWPGAAPQVVRLRFGDKVTNNEAEYDTLIAALEATLKRLEDQRADPATAQIDIRGDSLLVINQVLGEWKCKEARLETRRDHVRTLLKRFGRWHLAHHDRSHSVRALGH